MNVEWIDEYYTGCPVYVNVGIHQHKRGDVHTENKKLLTIKFDDGTAGISANSNVQYLNKYNPGDTSNSVESSKLNENLNNTTEQFSISDNNEDSSDATKTYYSDKHRPLRIHSNSIFMHQQAIHDESK
jgi:hypothetical protein